MKDALLISLLVYAIAAAVSMMVALMIKGLYALVSRIAEKKS